MWRLINGVVLLLVFFFVTATNLAQQAPSKAKAVVIPSGIYMPTVAQPDCPLKIEKAFVGKMLDGTEQMFFQARNTGSKPIVSFQIDMVGSNGGGQSAFFPYKRGQASVLPGAVAPPGLKEDSVEFVPLTEDLKQKLRLTGKMRVIALFMVLKVEFQDGTTYDAMPLLNSLEEHLRMFEDKYEKARLHKQ
jgi:hypothetical protein